MLQSAQGHFRISIHAPTRGATVVEVYAKSALTFQSTLPREERQYSSITLIASSAISIHAPTRGATRNTFCKHFFIRFQSTLPREERRGSRTPHRRSRIHFNPRSHERSDFFILFFRMVILYFNPRSHERSDTCGVQCKSL